MIYSNKFITDTKTFLTTLQTDKKGFKEAIQELGIKEYTHKKDLKGIVGKNIIIISLESLERGYLHDKHANLTPNLRSLKSNWNYHDLSQNHGSSWTQGALYTLLTGMPSFFGNRNSNLVFQDVHATEISSISNVLNNAGYDITFYNADANFAGTKEMLHSFDITNIVDKFNSTETNPYDISMYHAARDKDLFIMAKKEISTKKENSKPFCTIISTLDTHAPNGFFDERMKDILPPQNSNLEFMVSAVDAYVKDFIDFLEREELLKNTAVFILPDHLKLGNSSLFRGTGERNLFLITNIPDTLTKIANGEKIYQIDLPKIVLNGATVKHNQKFLTDYITTDKNQFIVDNITNISTANISGIQTHKNFKTTNSIKKNIDKTIFAKKDRFIATSNDSTTSLIDFLDTYYNQGFRYLEIDFLKYNEVNLNLINEWFSRYQDATLITSNNEDISSFSRSFTDTKRLIMKINEPSKVPTKRNVQLMATEHFLRELDEGDKEIDLKRLNINMVVLSEQHIDLSKAQAIAFKKENIKIYMNNIKSTANLKQTFTKKAAYIHGIFANEWSFN